MTGLTSTYRPRTEPSARVEPVRYLVVGRAGAANVGEWLTRFFLARRTPVSRLLAFDNARRITLYEIALYTTRIEQTITADYDIIINLDRSAMAYEGLLKKDGVFLLDESSLDARPVRRDIETVAVPTPMLAFKALQNIPIGELGVDQREVEEAVILGSTLAVESHHPTAK